MSNLWELYVWAVTFGKVNLEDTNLERVKSWRQGYCKGRKDEQDAWWKQQDKELENKND